MTRKDYPEILKRLHVPIYFCAGGEVIRVLKLRNTVVRRGRRTSLATPHYRVDGVYQTLRRGVHFHGRVINGPEWQEIDCTFVGWRWAPPRNHIPSTLVHAVNRRDPRLRFDRPR